MLGGCDRAIAPRHGQDLPPAPAVSPSVRAQRVAAVQRDGGGGGGHHQDFPQGPAGQEPEGGSAPSRR